MTDELIPIEPAVPALADVQHDRQLIDLWLQTEGRRSERTKKEYLRNVVSFADWFYKHGSQPWVSIWNDTKQVIRAITVQDLVDYALWLENLKLAPSTRASRLAAVKSILRFGHKIGYLKVNVGAVIASPIIENKLAERILSEQELFSILALAEKNLAELEGKGSKEEIAFRDLVLLKMFYITGGRLDEVVSLHWRNIQWRSEEDGGQVTFFGKGGKTRAVLIPKGIWEQLMVLHTYVAPKIGKGLVNTDNLAVFYSQKKNRLSRSQAWRVVRNAAVRAGLSQKVSPHWFRHAHVSHALDNGAPIHLVGETVGHSSPAVTGRYAHARPSDSSSNYLKLKK